jgi:hypothetical protein
MKAQRKEHKPRPSRDREKRAVLAKSAVRLFELWHLNSADSLALLGLSESNRIALQRYKSGEPLAANRDLLDRVGHLLAIHKSLKLLYPKNKEISEHWMTAPNRKFAGSPPIEVARRFGLPGIVMVRGTLDSMRGQ